MASTLTIVPTLGQALVSAQGQAGGYDAISDRAFWGVGRQEGVVGAGAFEVTERGAGANMSVDVACDVGRCVVEGDSVTDQGLYVVRAHPSVANLDVAAAHATLPRIDQVVVEVKDDEHDASGLTRARVYVLGGTATSGADLDDRLGAAALPDSTVRLADVLVPATDTTISDSQIRDRRPWALGAYIRIVRNTNESAADDYTTGNGSAVVMDATNLSPRVECSGAPVKVALRGQFGHDTVPALGRLEVRVDGAVVDGGQYHNVDFRTTADVGVNLEWEILPSAGSHIIALYWSRPTSGTLKAFARTAIPLQMTVAELVRVSEANNETTSG